MPPLPSIAKVARCDFAWSPLYSDSPFAHNIVYVYSAGSEDQISVSDLTAIATGILPTTGSAGWRNFLSSVVTGVNLVSVTVSDCGGSANQVVRLVTAAGTASAPSTPPSCAACVSWSIGARYRGGKPRTYLPGLPTSGLFNPGDAKLSVAYATGLRTAANQVILDVQSVTVGSIQLSLGTVSYHSGGALRPTPLFRPYLGAKVHERVDSQRRRLGKEGTFPVV